MQLSKFIRDVQERLHVDLRRRSEVERRVSSEAHREFHRQMAVVALTAGIVFHVVSLWTDHFVAEIYTQPILRLWHFYFAAATFPIYYLYRRWPATLPYCIVFQILVEAIVYAYVGYLACVVNHGIYANSILSYLGVMIVSIVLCPTETRPIIGVVLAMDVIGGVMVYAAVHDVQATTRWIFSEIFACLGAVLVQRYMTLSFGRAARAELQTQLQMAPAHVVAYATRTKEPLEVAFRPTRQSCACISVCWSDYDSLAYRLSDTRLAEILDSYYRLVDQLLEECITDGAFYCDVMVGDMFIVVFDARGGDGTRPLGQAFAFGRRLLRERALSTDPVLRLSRIDVGMSGGEALVGIMGPEHHRKTTGLGELPGRAGRLKGAAQLLRRANGTADRIVLDPASASVLGPAAGLERFEIPEGKKIKDLDEDALYYWEHAA